MKICMLVSRVPWPLEKGDKLRAYHQMRFLAKHHELHLLCLSDAGVDPVAIEHLKTITPHVEVFPLNRVRMLLRMFFALFSSKPFQVHYFYDRWVARGVRKTIEREQPDVIYCQLIRCSEYVKGLHHIKKTIDYMDALSAGQQRRAVRAPWYMRPFVIEEARRLKAYEHLIFDYFDHHTIISEQDQKLIYHHLNHQIHVVPNGIDAEFFRSERREQVDFDLLFTGNMSYPPNVECAQRIVGDILPLVQKKIPGVRLLLAGANPSPSVQSLASESVIVSGWMSDIRTAYSNSRVFLAPMLSGSGMQNKLLEAMSMKLPCVTTQLAAMPIGAVHQVNSLIATSDEELAACVLDLLSHTEKAREIGEAGRAHVKRIFDWSSTVCLLEDACFKSEIS
jgi:sugar transferase (PEP-CTERM/EpsH1 system associated)